MPKPSIDFLNARRALKPANGGAMQDWSTRQAPDCELDLCEQTELETDARCREMILNVEIMQQQLFERFGIVPAEHVDEIPF